MYVCVFARFLVSSCRAELSLTKVYRIRMLSIYFSSELIIMVITSRVTSRTPVADLSDGYPIPSEYLLTNLTQSATGPAADRKDQGTSGRIFQEDKIFSAQCCRPSVSSSVRCTSSPPPRRAVRSKLVTVKQSFIFLSHT